ncbi:uncharacterized protein LOC120332279 [Styela clava]
MAQKYQILLSVFVLFYLEKRVSGHYYSSTKPMITIAPTADYGYETDNSFRYPSYCKSGYCDYEAKWHAHSGYIFITIWAKIGKGYFAGIGFSDDRMMPNSDCITGGIPMYGYSFLLTDRYLSARSLAGIRNDEQQDAMLQSHSHVNGMLKFEFKRNLYTADTYDKSLDVCRFFLFSWGGRLQKNKLISKHTKAFATRKKICFVPPPTIPPTITIKPYPTGSYVYETRNSFSYPGRCDAGHCEYMAKWHADSHFVYFTIWANVGEGIWAGIGFSDDRMMPKSDCITGWKSGNSFKLKDRYLIARRPDAVPRDQQQDAILQSHSLWNGMLVFNFKRKINTGDRYDKSLDICRFFLFAWGGKGNADGSISAHTRQFVSKRKVCIAHRPTIGPPTLIPTIGPPTLIPTTKPKDYGYESQYSFRYPSYCQPGYCTFEANWRLYSGHVYFRIAAKVGLGYWAGIGFSDDRLMPDSDCITGWMTPGYSFKLKDRYLFARRPNAVPIDVQQDAVVQSYHHQNGMLKFSFKRKVNTWDKHDKSLDRCRYFLFSWGGRGFNDGRITAHTAQFATRRLICLEYNSCQHKRCGANQHCVHRNGQGHCQCGMGYYKSYGGYCQRYNYNQHHYPKYGRYSKK